MRAGGVSAVVRPLQAPAVDDQPHARVAVRHEHVQVGTGPAQRVETAQHVVADLDVERAQVEQVEGE